MHSKIDYSTYYKKITNTQRGKNLLDTVIFDLENYFTKLSKYELYDCLLRLKRAREELDEVEGEP